MVNTDQYYGLLHYSHLLSPREHSQHSLKITQPIILKWPQKPGSQKVNS